MVSAVLGMHFAAGGKTNAVLCQEGRQREDQPEEAIMTQNAISGMNHTSEPASVPDAAKKFGFFVCGTCIVGWTALGLAVVGVTLARVFGYF